MTDATQDPKERQREAWRGMAEAMHTVAIAFEALVEAHTEAPRDTASTERSEEPIRQGASADRSGPTAHVNAAEREEEAIKIRLATLTGEMEKAQSRSELARIYRETKSVLEAAPEHLQGTWTQAWQKRIDSVSKKRAVEGGFAARGAA